jgi:hypothetical protein
MFHSVLHEDQLESECGLHRGADVPQRDRCPAYTELAEIRWFHKRVEVYVDQEDFGELQNQLEQDQG